MAAGKWDERSPDEASCFWDFLLGQVFQGSWSKPLSPSYEWLKEPGGRECLVTTVRITLQLELVGF